MSIVKNFPLFNMEKEYNTVGQSIVGQERPVLLIWGTNDRVNPLKKSSRKIQKYFHNSFLLSVPDAGHVVLNEQPTIVISSIVSFLQQPDGKIAPSHTTPHR
jgi:pimeloyl-ACP methyl ester carboxylesterase